MTLILCIFYISFIVNIEGRVFCQDSNARRWSMIGYSCPVQCSTILHAIQKLQYMDYERIMRQEIGSELQSKIKLENIEIQINSKFLLKLLRRVDFDLSLFTKFSYNTTRKSMDGHASPNFGNFTLTRRYMKNEGPRAIENHTKIANCWSLEKFDKTQLIVKIKRVECTRKSNYDGKFLRMMTNILNMRVSSPFKFTTEMTEILLEKLFGKNTDLRHNIFDVNKLLLYLDKAMLHHRNHSHTHQVTLSSKHCLLINVPGCYCRHGFVESSGQCIKPSDCTKDASHVEYLARINVQ